MLKHRVQVMITKNDKIVHLFCFFLHMESIWPKETTTNKSGVLILVGKICQGYCFSGFTLVLVAVFGPRTVPSWSSKNNKRDDFLFKNSKSEFDLHQPTPTDILNVFSDSNKNVGCRSAVRLTTDTNRHQPTHFEFDSLAPENEQKLNLTKAEFFQHLFDGVVQPCGWGR